MENIPTPKSESKATAINNALNRLSHRVDDIQDLSRRISGDDTPESEKASVEMVPTIATLLEGRIVDSINTEIDRISAYIKEIDDKLF